MRVSITCALICLLALACSHSQAPQTQPLPGLHLPTTDKAAWYLRQRDSLVALDPVAEATAALAKGDRHLLGIVTYTLVVPGIGRSWPNYKPGILVFPGTGDFITSSEQGSYQRTAMEYAAKYNATILRASPCCE